MAKAKFFSVPADQDVIDAIQRLCAKGETVRLDDIVSEVHIKFPEITDRDIDAILQRLRRAGVIEHLRKLTPNGNARKIWGWVLTKKAK